MKKNLTTMAGVAALLCLTAFSVKAATLTNWARAGIATQSSTYPGGDAIKAIDGNYSGWWNDGSITHTADSENTDPLGHPWWQVDLQATKAIAHLHIWFRDDCCQARNNNLRIVIFASADTNGAVLWETNTIALNGAVPRELGFDITPAVNGRLIYVEHTPGQEGGGQNYVCISELEAFNQTPTSAANHALAGTATSSSCYVSDCILYGPQQAIDDNLHGATSIGGWPWAYSAPDNTAGVDPLPWWQVDLAAPQSVGSIVLWPRRDRTLTRFKDIRVTVADPSSAVLYQQVFTIQPSGPKFVLNFVPALANAKTLKIETTDTTPDKFLNLPEVQVFAPLATAPTITFTTNLQPITVNENLVVTFGPVAAAVDDGIRQEDISYRWFRNGVEIPNMAGSWIKSYTLPSRATPANNGDRYKVLASVSGHGTFSTEVVLTVTADTNAPVLQYANGDASMRKVRVWFSEPLDTTSAQTASNYQLSGGVTITSATLSAPAGSTGDNIVELVTSALTPGQAYTLTVTGVKDQSAAGNLVAPGSTAQFTAWTLVQGSLMFEHYDNLAGAADGDITTALNDPRVKSGAATTLALLSGSINTRNVFPTDSHENYLVRISGYITPTVSTNYYFFVRSDDASRVYLSTNATMPDPAVDTPICRETDCCDAFAEPGTVNDDGTTYPTTATPIPLVAGQRYAVLILLKEGGGGDWLGVAWRHEEDTTLATDLPYLPGEFLSTYVDPNTDLQFVKQPTDQPGTVPSTGIEIFSRDFNANDGGFTVVDTTDKVPPYPWIWDSATGKWVTEGSTAGCDGPYNSQLISPAYMLTQAGVVSLSFSHRYSFEGDLWDAGMVGIRVNGGSLTLVPAENFTANGYAPGNIIGNGIALGQRGFNGDSPGYTNAQFITSTVTLGTFKKDDIIAVHFIGAWDDCSSGTAPNWVIDSMKLNLVPMLIQDFASTNGGFTAADSGTPPAGWGGWGYLATNGTWTATGSDPNCGGPFNSKLTSPAYTVPVSDEVTLSFTHRYSLESDYYDGGQVWISVNGGAFTPVSPDKFTANGYAPGNIVGTGILNGQRAFNGDSAGYATNGLITSSVILGTFNQNDTIAVQFVGAWDECFGYFQPSWVIKQMQLAFGKAAKASTFESQATASKQGQPVAVSYQWQRNDGAGFVDIPNATGASFTIYPTAADFNAQFRVVASVIGKSLISNVVKLTQGAVTPPELSITTTGGAITITFTGRLQSSATVNGTYQDVTGATSPYPVTTPTGTRFYRSVK
jgi:hypothetical protein